jgi:hypothetical protein
MLWTMPSRRWEDRPKYLVTKGKSLICSHRSQLRPCDSLPSRSFVSLFPVYLSIVLLQVVSKETASQV